MSRDCASIRGAGLHLGSCLGGGLCDFIGMVYCGLDDLLFLRIQFAGEVLVERGLLLLEACDMVSHVTTSSLKVWANVAEALGRGHGYTYEVEHA